MLPVGYDAVWRTEQKNHVPNVMSWRRAQWNQGVRQLKRTVTLNKSTYFSGFEHLG